MITIFVMLGWASSLALAEQPPPAPEISGVPGSPAASLAPATRAELIIGSGMKAYGEASGGSKVEGRAKATAEEITDVLKKRFQQQGWIK